MQVDLHMVQLMPLPLTVSCFSKIQIGFTFLVPAHPGSPGKRAVKWLCVFKLVVHVTSPAVSTVEEKRFNGFILVTFLMFNVCIF